MLAIFVTYSCIALHYSPYAIEQVLGEGKLVTITVLCWVGFQVSRERLQLACDLSLSGGKVNKEALYASLANDCYINMVRKLLLLYLDDQHPHYQPNDRVDSDCSLLTGEGGGRASALCRTELSYIVDEFI